MNLEQNELTPMMSSNQVFITSNQICEIPDSPTHKELMRTIKNYIKNGYLMEYDGVKLSPSQESQESKCLIVYSSTNKSKQGKNVKNYTMPEKTAVFITAKFSDEVRLKLVNLLESKSIENHKLKNDLIALQQTQLDQYKKQFSITDNKVIIYDESEIPKNYIKYSNIKITTGSGLPKSRLKEILLAMKVPHVEYNSTYESSDGVIHKGKIALAFLLRDENNVNLIKKAFNDFKQDLVQISEFYSYSQILNSKIKYVNNF